MPGRLSQEWGLGSDHALTYDDPMSRFTWFAVAVGLAACASDDQSAPPAVSATPGGAYRQVAELDRAAVGPVQVLWDQGRDRPAMVVGEFAAAGAPEAAARQFLATHASLFRLDPGGRDLKLMTTRRGRAGTYLRFQQVIGDLPVFDRQVVVTVSATGDRVRAAQLDHVDVAVPPLATDVGAAAALAAARAQLGAPAEQLPPTVERGLDVDHGAPRVVYRVTVAARRATWEVGVDAATGATVWTRDRNVNANGTGMVFDANAIASTGNHALVDNNNATSAALDAARFSVTLPNLDGTGPLKGLYVDARPPNAGQRSTSAGLTFNFNRSQTGFEEVMAYYHIDRTQTRIQALGFTSVNNRAIVAVVNDGNQDNSFYSPANKQLSFGAGGVDDAEDAEVIIHEYGHSIQDNQVPGWGGGNEGAMGEGFGDYLAASMAGVLAPLAGHPQMTDPACVADWDAISYDTRNPPCLRRLDEPKHYPEDADGEVHDDGEMWSAALWRARTAVGADIADSVVIEGHELLGTTASFDQAANAILTADQMLFAGANRVALRRALYHTGVLRTTLTGAAYPTVAASMAVSVGNPVSGGLYANNLDDVQTVSLAGAAAVRVHFTTIATETTASCPTGACDSVYVFDGNGDLYQILNGTQTDVTSVQVPGDTIKLRLVTNRTGQRAGYHVDRIDAMGGVQPTDAAVPIDAPAAVDAPAPVIDAPAPPIDAPAPPIDAPAPVIDAPPAAIDAAAGPDAADPGKGDESGGCCQTGQGGAAPTALLGLGAGAALLRRRRRR